MKCLDTSVAVDHLRGAPAAFDLLRRVLDDGEAVVASEVVRFELLAGVRDDERDDLEQFFSALSWVAVDESVTRTAGLLARQHRRSHGGIDDADYLIAATSIILEAQLLTLNVRHFPMITGLQPAF
jgi:predicted nucleic acid-binding protein